MALGEVSRRTLREQVWENLRSAILEGRLVSGTRLGEVDLAEQLNVSRGTVREALRLLQQSGLVEGEDRLGLRVTTFDECQLVELYEVRAAIESLAAETIVRRGESSRVADELEAILPHVPEGTSIRARLDANLAFHEALCRASGNETLLQMWLGLQDRMRVAIVSGHWGRREDMMERDYHLPIVIALREGDPERARVAIVEHMRHAGSVWAELAKTQLQED